MKSLFSTLCFSMLLGITPVFDAGDGLQYGYQWWAGKIDALGAKQDWSAGFGNGGQRLFIIPNLDMLVVITAGDYNKPIGLKNYQLFNRIVSTVQK